jgi:GDP-4-dehydro-6-deoxy-D-mannose reductase
VARETVALQYHLAHGVRTVRVRTFNLIGPGQSTSLLAADVTRQLVQAEYEGTEAIIRVGNLFPRRDYTDVRDAIRAYLLLAARAQGGELYNVCSGHSRSVQECLDLLATVSPVRWRVVVEAARVRTVEIDEQVGDPTRLARLTGWTPVIPMARILQDMLAYWRSRLEVASRA